METSLEARTARQLNFCERLTGARDHLLASVAGLDEATLCGEAVFGAWTAHDLIGHCVSWNEELRAEIEIIRQGRHPGYENQISGEMDFDAWNQARVAEKRTRTWRQTLDDVERDYAEAVELIMRLEPREYRMRGVTPWKEAAITRPALPTTADTQSIETLMTFHWRHMNGHARHIERWRKKRGI
ncbi:MAG: DinB family protein [Anaerolineae bacterium]|jgi:hypothetical protein|nr:DinB family protein [Anaerolineae bacterium]